MTEEEIQQLFTEYQQQGIDIAVENCNHRPKEPSKSRQYDVCDNVDRYWIKASRST